MASLPGLAAGAPAVTTAVTDALQGEVAAFSALTAGKVLSVSLPANSVAMVTVPRVTNSLTTLTPTDDTTLNAGANSGSTAGGLATTLKVFSSNTATQGPTSVAMLKFSLGAIAPTKVISAILTLTQAPAVAGAPQVLTVLGTSSSWAEGTLTWTGAAGFGLSAQPDGMGVTSVATNFVNYANVKAVVGHLTCGSAATVALDVTDYLRGVNPASFMIARVFRFDARGTLANALKADVLGNTVTFSSSEAASNGPTLRVYVAA
jgi:hypothetical protein